MVVGCRVAVTVSDSRLTVSFFNFFFFKNDFKNFFNLICGCVLRPSVVSSFVEM